MLCALALGAAPVRAQPSPDLLKQARDAFEYGDYARTVRLLDVGASQPFAAETDRVEAFRLLGLSYFYLHKKNPTDPAMRTGAQEAFFDLLKQNPDFELDPFYTPPEAVSFFDRVRRDNESYLGPIRERRRARIREQQLEDEARRAAEARRRAEQRENVALRPLVIERELQQSSALVAFMPFGLGQFQNGDTRLGIALLASELVTAAVSMISWGLIEQLRDSSGRFQAESAYPLALRLETVKYVSAGLFYSLWVGGALEANLSFVPSKVVRETTLTPPSAAPDRALEPPLKLTPATPPTPAPAVETPPAPEPAPAPEPDAEHVAPATPAPEPAPQAD